MEPVLQHIWDSIDFTSLITLMNYDGSNLAYGIDYYQTVKNQNGYISIFFKYNANIQNNNFAVSISLNNSDILSLQKSQILSKSFVIVPSDNQIAYYY